MVARGIVTSRGIVSSREDGLLGVSSCGILFLILYSSLYSADDLLYTNESHDLIWTRM